MNKKIILAILAIAVMIFFIVLISNKPAEEILVEDPAIEELSDEEPLEEEAEEVKLTEEVEDTEKNDIIVSPIDCGKAVLTDIEDEKNVEAFLRDFACIIEASKECKPAIITITLNYNYLRMANITTAVFSEIKGPEKNKCVLYMRADEIDLWFSPLVPKKTVNEAKTLAGQLKGTDGICRFETADLTALLYKWREGDFSPEDLETADCEGEFFDQNILF